MERKRRRFSREYKQEVVEMVVKGGQSISELSKDLEIRPDMIRRWVKQHRQDPEQAFPGQGRLKERDEELRRLRRKNRVLHRPNMGRISGFQENTAPTRGSLLKRCDARGPRPLPTGTLGFHRASGFVSTSFIPGKRSAHSS